MLYEGRLWYRDLLLLYLLLQNSRRMGGRCRDSRTSQNVADPEQSGMTSSLSVRHTLPPRHLPGVLITNDPLDVLPSQDPGLVRVQIAHCSLLIRCTAEVRNTRQNHKQPQDPCMPGCSTEREGLRSNTEIDDAAARTTPNTVYQSLNNIHAHLSNCEWALNMGHVFSLKRQLLQRLVHFTTNFARQQPCNKVYEERLVPHTWYWGAPGAMSILIAPYPMSSNSHDIHFLISRRTLRQVWSRSGAQSVVAPVS
eukprot:284819889_5